MTPPRVALLLLSAGAFGALGATACCAAPRIVALLGCKVRWASQLFTELAPYHPAFVTIAAGAFGLAHYRLYGAPMLPDAAPCQLASLKGHRIAHLTLAAISLALILFPLYAPKA
jgi:hypothetical protein